MKFPINTEYEILTENGWKNFDGIKETKRNIYYKITFSDKSFIECTPEHKIKLSDGFYKAQNIIMGDITSSNLKIINIEILNDEEKFYDLINVEDGNEYITNNVTSHNCAFVEKNLWDDFWKSTYPTISSSKESKIIISSTPNGYNHFWKFWNDAITLKNGYSFLKVLWPEVPGRDEKWKEDTLKELNGDTEHFNSEFECEFIGSAGTLISSYALKYQMLPKDPIDMTFEDKFKIYKYPEENHTYILMVDPAEGIGEDYSTVQVIDILKNSYEQVAVFRSNTIGLKEFPYIISNIGKMYGDKEQGDECGAVVIGENNLYGEILDNLNYELDYPAIFFDSKFGIRMTTGTKNSGNSFLKRDIEDGKLIIVDPDTIFEFSTFIKIKNSYSAEAGYHDDLITPLILFSYFMKQKTWVEDWVNEGIYNPGNIKQINDDLLPAGFRDEGYEVEMLE